MNRGLFLMALGAKHTRWQLTRWSSATAGGGERGKHRELFHKIKSGHHNGRRLAPAIG
jgi:hypothetical protein